MKYKRVILKVSGEALLDEENHQPISPKKVEYLIGEIKSVVSKIELAIVVGAGNFFRGASLSQNEHLSPVAGDNLGIVSTMLNGLYLREVFRLAGLKVKIVSALALEGIIERYYPATVDEYLSQGNIVILVGGTGNPGVTTDTALCLRGIELNADLLIKATHKVEGVYSDDPLKNDKAELYTKLTYDLVLQKGLKVMDQIAFYLGKEHGLTLGIYNFNKPQALQRLLKGEVEGTVIQ